MITAHFNMDPKKVPRCAVCGARAYWTTAKPPVCVACTLKAEKLDDGGDAT